MLAESSHDVPNDVRRWGAVLNTMTAAIVFILFFGGSVLSMILVDMLFNDGWVFALTVLGILELVIVPVLLLRLRFRFSSASIVRKISDSLIMIGACVVFLIVGAPYVLLVNALTSSGDVVLFSGLVVNKKLDQGKGKALIIEIIEQRTDVPIKLMANRDEYDGVAVGDRFSRCMMKGGLGYPFIWRFGLRPRCDSAGQ